MKMKNTKDWLIAIVGVISALMTIAIITYVSMDTSVADETKKMMWVIIPIVAIVSHIIALVKVKHGTLTVYRGWKDFGISCIWPITAILTALPYVAIVLAESDTGKNIALLVSAVFAVATIVSLAWMFFGSFANNRGKLVSGLIALIARTTASLFFITYVSKLLEIDPNKERSLQDYVRVVIGFIIFGIWFKMLVIPLVKDNREEAVNIEEL